MALSTAKALGGGQRGLGGSNKDVVGWTPFYSSSNYWQPLDQFRKATRSSKTILFQEREKRE